MQGPLHNLQNENVGSLISIAREKCHQQYWNTKLLPLFPDLSQTCCNFLFAILCHSKQRMGLEKSSQAHLAKPHTPSRTSLRLWGQETPSFLLWDLETGRPWDPGTSSRQLVTTWRATVWKQGQCGRKQSRAESAWASMALECLGWALNYINELIESPFSPKQFESGFYFLQQGVLP